MPGRDMVSILPKSLKRDPGQQGWASLDSRRVQRRYAKLEPITNYQLQKSIFLGVGDTSQGKAPPLKRPKDVSREKLICESSSKNMFSLLKNRPSHAGKFTNAAVDKLTQSLI